MEHHIKKVHNLDSDTYYISVTTKKEEKTSDAHWVWSNGACTHMWNMWTNIENKRHSEIIWMLVIVISRALSYPNYISLCPMLRWLHRWVKLDNVTIISKQADWKTDEGNVQSDLLFSPEIGFSWVCASNQPPGLPFPLL